MTTIETNRKERNETLKGLRDFFYECGFHLTDGSLRRAIKFLKTLATHGRLDRWQMGPMTDPNTHLIGQMYTIGLIDPTVSKRYIFRTTFGKEIYERFDLGSY